MSSSYYPIMSNSMKCRLYPNEEQREKIDRILYGIRIVYNTTLYDMMNEHKYTKEKPDENGNIVHFPDIKQMWQSEHLKELRKQYPIVNEIPASAISSNNGVFISDMKRMLCKLYENAMNSPSDGKMLPIEKIKEVNYVCNKHPRRSYTYQEVFRKISFSENKNVFYIDLCKLGKVKGRGIRRDIKFDSNGKVEFEEYCTRNPGKQITVTISKDNCGDYYIIFKFSADKRGRGIITYKKYEDRNIEESVGIDVGKKTLATLSDGNKYENKRFKKQEEQRLKTYNKKLSRMEGWKNPKFRKKHEDNKDLEPSKRYMRLAQKNRKLHRKIARRRENYNHFVSHDIVSKYGFIGIESLSITEMFGDTRTKEQKDFNSPEFIPKKRICREHDNTADAAMGQLLEMIKYKSQNASRAIVSIGRYFASSKTCSKCGYINKELKLEDRFWECKKCGTMHDRDDNAAECIEIEALRLFYDNQRLAS